MQVDGIRYCRCLREDDVDGPGQVQGVLEHSINGQTHAESNASGGEIAAGIRPERVCWFAEPPGDTAVLSGCAKMREVR